MAKRKKPGKIVLEEEISKPLNFVQKHMNTFNHSRTFKDKKNDYSRKVKHRNKDTGAFFVAKFS